MSECVSLLCPEWLPEKRGEALPIPRGGSTEIPPTGALEAEEIKSLSS